MSNWVLFEVTDFTDATCDTTANSATITCNSSSKIRTGQRVQSPRLMQNSYVKTVNTVGSVTSFTIADRKTDISSLAITSGTNTAIRFIYNHPSDMFAYPLKHLNALIMTTDNSIDLYFRNPIQPTEAVSDDKITITINGGEGRTFMNKILDIFNKRSLDGKKFKISDRSFSEIVSISRTAGT